MRATCAAMINPGLGTRGCDLVVNHHSTAHPSQQPYRTRRIVVVSGADHQHVSCAARAEVGSRPPCCTPGQSSARVAAISSGGAARSCHSSPWHSSRVQKRQPHSEPCRAARQTMSESLEEVNPGLTSTRINQAE